MKEVEEKAKKICELKDSLMCQVKPYVDADVFCETVDGMAVGQVIDMIKDLCDAEKNLYKACYYKTVTKAMKEAEEEQKMMEKMGIMMGEGSEMEGYRGGRSGYDNWRYSSGRFAPKGSGHYAGYMMPHMRDGYPDFENPVARNEEILQDRMGMLGYSGSGSGSSGGRGGSSSSQGGSRGGNQGGSSGYGNGNSGRRSGRYGYPMDERHGMAYNDYNDAKKYYHESKDPEAKKEMQEHAKEHLNDVVDTTKDIWMDASTEKKKEFKKQMMELLKDVPA